MLRSGLSLSPLAAVALLPLQSIVVAGTEKGEAEELSPGSASLPVWEIKAPVRFSFSLW